MFDNLFKCPDTIEAYSSAPLADERLSFLHHLRESGSGTTSLRHHACSQLRLVRLLELTDDQSVSVVRIEAAVRSAGGGSGFPRQASASVIKVFVADAVRWMRFLGRLEEPGAVRHSHAVELDVWVDWMRRDRGLSQTTVGALRRVVEDFFDRLAPGGTVLSAITISDIDRTCAAWYAERQLGRRTRNIYARRLRAFFLFAESRGLCTPDLSVAIVPPRVYAETGIPRGFARGDVIRLLATTEGDQPSDIRDRAMLMLFITYGLRSGEVAGLRLDDVDWLEETLRVRCPKPGTTRLLPLSPAAGHALLRYLREVRPRHPDRTLFLTLKAPFQAIDSRACSGVVRRRADRLGIRAPCRGAHALRHAAAQHLLDQGMSMKVIGDYLGHRSPSTTAIYARIDLKALREVADCDPGDLS